MDLATKIIGLVVFGLSVAGIIYRLGKTEQKMVGNIELLDAKIEALKGGQKEILAEVKAHTGDEGLHVNERLEALKTKVDEEFRRDVARKLDELLRIK